MRTNGTNGVSEKGTVPSGKHPVVLWVDDEADLLDSVCSLLRIDLPHVRVLTAESGARALQILTQEQVDLIITDYSMPGMNGLEFAASAITVAPEVPRVLCTAMLSQDLASRAIQDQLVAHVLSKPLDPKAIAKTIRALLGNRFAS